MSHYGLDEQIDHLRHGGISFEIMSESDARRFWVIGHYVLLEG